MADVIEHGESEGGAVATLFNDAGVGPVVLVCEHASNFIPSRLNNLGLDMAARQSHIAWDIGALGTAQAMSKLLSAPLVVSNVSRLVYDCNRPPDAPSAMPDKSEIHVVPGNRDLDTLERRNRATTYYVPFHDLLAGTLAQMGKDAVLVTVHSFTPVFHGQPRQVELGILHDLDSRLADAMLDHGGETGLLVERNAPYGPQDGVTHTLKEHGIANGIANVMLEIRNDLIRTGTEQKLMAAKLTRLVHAAMDTLGPTRSVRAAQA
jgi:predicted N-formylglutamate amidohydrolase